MVRSLELQIELMSSSHLEELLRHIKAIEGTTKLVSDDATKTTISTGKDIFSNLPTELIFQIALNLEEVQDLIAFKSANPREFGISINKVLRDHYLLPDESSLISAMFEAAAKRDVNMIHWLFESKQAVGKTLILDKPHSSFPDEEQFRIEHNGTIHWYFRLTGERLDDELMDLILTSGPNLMMAISTENTLLSRSPLGPMYVVDQYTSKLQSEAHSAITFALQTNEPDQVERYIRLGTSTRLATSKTVSEFINHSVVRSRADSTDWNLEGRWAVARGEADALFFHTPLEEIDPWGWWDGGNNLLHMALFSSNPSKMIKFALSKGLGIDDTNQAGEWPLQLALENDQIPAKVLSVLLDYGADTWLVPQYLTDTNVFALASQTKIRREKVAVFLDWANIDWVARDAAGNFFGETLLHVAVIWAMPIKHFKSLLKRGLAVNVLDNFGKTPLDLAWDILGMDTGVDAAYWNFKCNKRGYRIPRREIMIEIIEFLMKRGGAQRNLDTMAVAEDADEAFKESEDL